MENNTAQVVLVKDINPGVYSSYTSDFTEFNEQLFFSAFDGENGGELWVSDGTTEGTQLLLDINPGGSGSGPSYLIEVNEQLFFFANDGENGNELWVSDGTTEGTQLLLDINPGVNDSISSSPYNFSNETVFTEVNEQLFFFANDGENGNELWVSDGTTEGTQLLLDINPGVGDSRSYSFYVAFTEFNEQLFFSADDGENGTELWVSDGTTEGTQLLLDIDPGGGGSFPLILSSLTSNYFSG